MVSVGKEYRQTLFSAQYVKNRFIGDERSSVCQLCQKQHDLWK